MTDKGKKHQQLENSPSTSTANASETFVKLATMQPTTKVLDPNPKTLKYFPLRRTARLFVIADALMASILMISRFFIAGHIVTYPIFQIASTTLYLLVSCLGIYQIFSENSSSFPLFLMAYPITIVLNFTSTIILAMQTFDMGLITDNCGDKEFCDPHVMPLALAGWIMVAGSFAFIIINALMMRTYWQLSNRLIEEQQCTGMSGQPFMHTHTHSHHQYSHQNYPINYSRSSLLFDVEKANAPDASNHQQTLASKESHGKIRTPQPKLAAKNIFSDPNDIVFITKTDANKFANYPNNAMSYPQYFPAEVQAASVASSVISTDYKSLQISPLDFSALHQQQQQQHSATDRNIY